MKTVSVLASFFLAMALYPRVQIKAQVEIDRFLEQRALPTLSEREKLPYIDCIIKEVLRWQPAVPLSMLLVFPPFASLS